MLPVFVGLATLSASAAIEVTVDPSQAWIGYMNVFNIPSQGGGYVFGQPWGTGALTAFFDPSDTVSLTLEPCTNVWETSDTFWVQADKATPNKTCDASMYVQNDTLAGQTVNFVGTCTSYNLNGGYTCTAFIKDFSSSYSLNNSATIQLAAGQPFNLSLATGGGDHIQYGFETIGLDANPATSASLGKAVIAVQILDPSLNNLTGQALVAGQNASFTETPSGTGPFTYQWTQTTGSGTTTLSTGGRYNITTGASSTLTISSIQASDAGTYTVKVTDPHGNNSVNAPLVVIPLATAQTNYLIDPSFESSTFATASTAGWYSFNGCAFQNDQEFYYLSDEQVSVFDGTNCLETYNGGAYDGAFQDRPASPGEVFTGYAWFLTPSSDEIAGANTCILEVQFRDSGGNVLVDYQSAPVTASTTPDVWYQIGTSTEYAADFVTVLSTGPLIIAPKNAASVRYQITFHAPAGDGGEVDVDACDLTLHEPLAPITFDGTKIHLSVPTLFGPTYKVLWRSSATSGTWSTLTSFSGDGTTHDVQDTPGPVTRFYTVNTQ
jgi:hypothetical protein